MTVQRPFYGLIKATGIVGLALTMVCSLLFIFGGMAEKVEAKPLAETPVTSNIDIDTTWYYTASPYLILTNTVSVISSAVLSIEPGVEVRFQNSARLQIQSGQLMAIGTATRPITFTAAYSTPTRGYWEGLIFDTHAATSTIEYALIEYARGAIQINNTGAKAPINVYSSTIRYVGDNGAPIGGAILGSPDNSRFAYNRIYSAEVGIDLAKVGLNYFISNEIFDIDGYGIGLFNTSGTNSSNNFIINNIIYNCRGNGIRLEGISATIKATGQRIIGNIISQTNNEAIYALNQNSLIIDSNLIYSTALTTATGMGGTASNLAAIALIQDDNFFVISNRFYDNGGDGNYFGAIYITDTATIDPFYFPNNLFITYNFISDHRASGLIYAGSNTVSSQSFHSNAICVDNRYEVENRDGLLDVHGNWFGTNFPAVGTEIIGAVTYSPYITLTETAAPIVLPADGLSTAIITLTMTDGTGHTVPSSARTVNLTTNLGTLSPAQVTLDANGIATTTLTSSRTVGLAVITATEFCGYPVTATVEFTATDVAVSKTAALTQIIPGQTVTYTLAYSNNNAAAATNVIITDTLPGGMQYVSDDAPGFGPASVSGQNVSWRRSSLPGPITGVITLVARLNPTATNQCGQLLTNQVVITTATVDSNPTNNNGSDSGVSVICADVSIRKVGPSSVVVGDTITYTLYYSNTGSAPAFNVVITDVNSITNSVVITLVNSPVLTPSQPFSVTYPVFVPASVCTNPVVINTGYINTTTPESTTANNSWPFTSTVLCHDVTISKTLAHTAESLGKDTIFTITYRNIGVYTASGVVITDFLANNVTYITDTLGGAVTSTNAVTWYLGNIGPNSPVYSFTINLRPNVPPAVCNNGFISFTNRVRIDSSPLDNMSNNESPDINSGNIPCNNVDLVIVKNDGIGWPSQRQVVYAGEVFTYTIVYNNAGGATATGVVITETLPEYTEFVGPTVPPGSRGWFSVPSTRFYVYYPGAISGTLTSKEGDKLDFAVRVVPTLPATVTWVYNRIDIGSQQTDAVPGDNVSYEQTPVRAIPDLVVTKTVIYPPVVRPGDVITYRVTLANQGIGTATNVILTDFLPNYTAYKSDSSGLPRQGSSPISWTIASLPPGAPPISFTLTLTAGANICNVDWLTNTVEVDPEGPDRNDNNNRSQAVLPVGCRDVAITKTVNITRVNPGSMVVFNLTYSNPGLITTTQTVITDTLPNGITFDSSNPVTTSGAWPNYVWTLGALTPNITSTIILTGYVSDIAPCGQTLTNTAGITAAFVSGTETFTHNNYAESVVLVSCIPDLITEKNDRIGGPNQRPFIQPGEVFTYSILYSNIGIGSITGVVLTETLPNYTDFVGPADRWFRIDATNQYTYYLGTVNAGAGRQAEFAVQVHSTLPPSMFGKFITNTVCIGGQGDEIRLDNNCSFEQTLVITGPRLEVFKTAVPADQVVVGQIITYSVVTINSGQATANNVRITDTLPLTEVNFITATLNPSGPVYRQGNILTATVSSLAVGNSVTMTVVVTVNNVISGTIFTNTATSIANTLPVVTGTVTHTVVSAVDMAITKEVRSLIPLQPGALINYGITVTNLSNFTATNVIVTDTLPIGTIYITDTTGISPTLLGNLVIWNLGQFNPNRPPFTFTLTLTASLPCVYTPTNRVEVRAAQIETNTINNTWTVTGPTFICNDVTISKVASPTQTTSNQNVRFTLTYTNAGELTANNVRVTDTLPTGIDFVNSTPPPNSGPVNRVLTWTLNNLSSRFTGTIVLTGLVRADACNSVQTNTTVITATVDDAPNNNIAMARVIVGNQVDLSVTKTTLVTETAAGQLITYTINYQNLGCQLSARTVLTETLPEFTNFVGSTGWTPINNTRFYTYSVGNVPPSGVVTFTVRVTSTLPLTATTITNTVCIGGAENDVAPANNCAVITTPIVTRPNLSITKIATPPGGTTVTPTQRITYTVRVHNNGNAPAYNVRITDTLPAGVTVITATPALTALIPILPVSTTFTLTAVVAVNSGLPGGTILTNTARTSADTLPMQSSLPVTHIVTITPSLGITKTATPPSGPIQPGQTITYTVVVSNNTDATANTVRITDTLPLTEVNFITATLSTGSPVYRQSNILTTTIVALAVGNRVTMTVVVTVNNVMTGTVFTNTATASADALALVTATVTHIVTPTTRTLGIVKLGTPSSQVHPGQSLTYTVVVSNNTGAAVSNARITDTLPVSYVTFIGADLSSGGAVSFISPTLTATLPSPLAPGVPITLTVSVLVNTSAPVGAIFTNTAWADASGIPVVTATATHQVITNSAVYLPIILKNYTPPSAALAWRDQNDDRVSEVDGSDPQAFTPDGRADGAFILTVNTGGAAKTVVTVTLMSTQSSATWNTPPGDGVIVLGIFNGGTRLNNANGSINQSITGQAVVTVYASDDLSGSRFPPDTYDYTVYVTFSDGSMVSASARIPPPPPSNCGPYKILRVGNDPHGVAVDADHHRVYVANYGSNSVSVVNTDNNTVLQTITGITKANGIAYDSARNIIWVTNQLDNRVTPIEVTNTEATSFTVRSPVMVGSSPWGVAVDSTHGLVYVVNNLSQSVTVIDAVTRNAVYTVTGQFNNPFHVAVNQITGKAYIPNFGGPSVTVLAGATVSKVIDLFDSTQPYGVAVDELRNIVYVTTVNSHRIVPINGATDTTVPWTEFHRGWNNARPVPLRAIAVNPDIPSDPPVMEDGGHVWATTSTGDGSELDQALLIRKGSISSFHSPLPCNEVSTTPKEGIAVNSQTDRVYVTSGAANGWLTVFTDPVVPPLIYLEVDDKTITLEQQSGGQ